MQEKYYCRKSLYFICNYYYFKINYVVREILLSFRAAR